MAKQLYRLSDIMPENARNVKKKYTDASQRNTNHALFSRANQAWENLRRVRETAERTQNYTFADDQWGDLIFVDGRYMTEREYIQRQGNVPLTDNMMISIFSSLAGLYDKQGSEPNAIARENKNVGLSDMMTATLQCNWQNNKVPRTLSVCFRQFLNSGVGIVRTSYDMMDDGVPDVNHAMVSPDKAFWEAGTDPNMRDLTLIGQLCDMPRERIFQIFANKQYGWTKQQLIDVFHMGEPWEEANRWDAYFGGSTTNDFQNDRNRLDNISFTCANTPHCYRIIEVWSIQSKERIQCWDPTATSQEQAYFKIENEKKEVDAINRINQLRREQCRSAGITDENEMPLILMEDIVDTFWHYTYMTPDAVVLCEGETPFDHKSHPFSIILYPYVNGRVYPFLSFVIDQQRNINRLNIMNDLAIRSATKGLTIYPEDIIPDDMTPEDFDSQLTSYRGVVRYKINRLNANARPDVLTSQPANLGIKEMLQLKINLMQQTANVSGALQGKTPSAGTSASRYAMEAENSTTSLFTIINDFSGFMEDIALKTCETIKQYYEDRRLIFSEKGESNMIEYDRMGARDVKFKCSIRESAATAAHQQRLSDQLDKLLQMQAIDIKTYLKNSPEPFAPALLQEIRKAEEEGQMANANIQVPGADQQAVAAAQQMMDTQSFNNINQQ